MRIKKLGVVGAGAMGSGIAALAASAGVPVVLLDIPGEAADRGEPARRGLERASKSKPAPFMDRDRARLVTTGNTEDDLELLAPCDWVVEAIIEQPGPKQALYARLEEILGPDALVTSNTSGIPMSVLTQGRRDGFKRRFLGTHFFNPPRYLHLLELIPTPDTSPEALRTVTEFGDRVLGKGIVLAKDAPGFIANRLGVYGLVQTIRAMEEFDLGIDEVDALTGTLLGRPKSATFRTADISGLDVLSHVTSGLASAKGEDFTLPGWVRKMFEAGDLGEKTGAGFYRKEGKQILTLNRATGEYEPQTRPEIPGLDALARRPLAERVRGALELPVRYGAFTRKLFALTTHYTLEKASELAYDLVSIDHAMEWGYGWEQGPLRQVDMVGVPRVRELLSEHGLPEPEMLQAADERIYKEVDGVPSVLTFAEGYASIPQPAGTLPLAAVRAGSGTLEENAEAALLDLGDGVVLLELRAKMGTIGAGVVEMVGRALERIDREDRAGLVIGHEDPRTFSAGANLAVVVAAVQAGEWSAIDRSVRAFQDTSIELRRAPFPVVSAPFGLALGGACEFSLHADLIQAHAELYMGLVEAGVGLLPGGGGTKELLFRFTGDLEPYGEADPFEAVRRAFELIAMAKTSTSALEARRFGFLRGRDRISMNRDRLIADAKQRVLDLAPGYTPPVPRVIRALGKDAIGNLRYGIWSMREAGQITDHEVLIAGEIAYVLCGGDGSPREVTEQDILDLEREAFLRLLGTSKTQERIAHTLKTGKPLRN